MKPSLRELFAGFLEVTLSGFGGVLAWAHRTLVVRRGWLSESEFTDLLAVSQILPGGNIVNVAIFVGARFQGLRGVLVALSGLMVAPLCLLLVVNALVTGPGIVEISGPALRGAAPVVAGLTLATGLRMARAYRWTPTGAVFATLTFGAVALLQVPLLLVLAVLAPFSVALAWRRST
ncbi:MAG TPA: chromate transporter [Chloroflexota bacterium]|nr:chromate transporter [Chloroflexota bacterium]